MFFRQIFIFHDFSRFGFYFFIFHGFPWFSMTVGTLWQNDLVIEGVAGIQYVITACSSKSKIHKFKKIMFQR